MADSAEIMAETETEQSESEAENKPPIYFCQEYPQNAENCCFKIISP